MEGITMAKKYRNFIIETFRFGYCERYNIQARNLKELTWELNDKNLVLDENCYLAIP